jgi:hypothetical protein
VQKRPENILGLVGTDHDFLNGTGMAQQLREWIYKRDYMKLKSFCTTKEMVTKLKN